MELLLKLFFKNSIEDERTIYGKCSSILSILFNICLFTMKFVVGTIFHSVSITADAFNNLGDVASNIVSFVSVVLSNKPADKGHPYGHARLEYIGSLIVSFLILLFAYELITSSISNIIHPVPLEFDKLMIIVLTISICVKFYMYFYNNKYGNKVNSSILKATAIDSLSDCLSTSSVIIAIVISKFTNLNLDPYMGVLVSLIILKSGIEIIKETIDKLLGDAPDREYENYLQDFVRSYDGILDVHDLVIHSYGENKTFISIHAEINSSMSLSESHIIVDKIERDLKLIENVDAVIHVDPIEMDDKSIVQLRKDIVTIIDELNDGISMHDFHVTRGEEHNHIMFDIRIHSYCKLDREEVIDCLQFILPKKWEGKDNEYIIDIDQAYQTSRYSEH